MCTILIPATPPATTALFTINNSGQIKVATGYTLMVPLFDSKVYTFYVRAVSTVHTVLAEVEITMNSANHLVHNTVLSGLLVVLGIYGVN